MADKPKFHIHYNRELGKKYYSARDYYGDMKKAGLEPYDPKSVKHQDPKPYKQSEWAKGMMMDIKNRNGRRPGSRFIEELRKRGYSQESAAKAMEMAKGR